MSDAISVECPKCHAKLKLKNRNAVGKRVPCPKCKQPFVVPAPPADDDEFAFMNMDEPEADEYGEPANAASEEDELPEPLPRRGASRPGRKKSKGSTANWQKPLLIGGGGLLLVALLAGGGFLAFEFAGDLFGPKNKIDLAYLPPDADLIVHVRLAEAWNAPLLQSLVTSAMVKPQIDNFQQEVGMEPRSITSITLGQSGMLKAMGAAGTAPQSSSKVPVPLMVVRATTPFDVEKLALSGGQKTEQVPYKGQTYHRTVSKGPADSITALFCPKPDILLVGAESDITSAIDRGKKSARRADLDFIDATRHVSIVFAPRESSDFDSSKPLPPGMPASISRLLSTMNGKVKGMCIGFSVGDAIDWTITANCTTPEAATTIASEIGTSLQEAKSAFGQLKSAIPPQMVDIGQLGDSMLASIKPSSKVAVLEVAGQIPGSIKTTIEKYSGMIAGGMLPMPGLGGPTPPTPQWPAGASNGQFPGGTLPGGLPPGQFSQGAFPSDGAPENANPPAGRTPQ